MLIIFLKKFSSSSELRIKKIMNNPLNKIPIILISVATPVNNANNIIFLVLNSFKFFNVKKITKTQKLIKTMSLQL